MCAFEIDDVAACFFCLLELFTEDFAFIFQLRDLAAVAVFVEQKDTGAIELGERFFRVDIFTCGEEDVFRFFTERVTAYFAVSRLADVRRAFKNRGGDTEEMLTGCVCLDGNDIGFSIVYGAFFAEGIFAITACYADDLALDAIASAILGEDERAACSGRLPADISHLFLAFRRKSVENEANKRANGRFSRFVSALNDVDTIGKTEFLIRQLAEVFYVKTFKSHE